MPPIAAYKSDRKRLELQMMKQMQKDTQAARLSFAYRNLNNHFYNIPIKLKYVYDNERNRSVPTYEVAVTNVIDVGPATKD